VQSFVYLPQGLLWFITLRNFRGQLSRALFHALLQFIIGNAYRLIDSWAWAHRVISVSSVPAMRLKASASVPISSRAVTATRASKRPAAIVFALSVNYRIGLAKRLASHKPRLLVATSVTGAHGVVGSDGDQPPIAFMVGAVGA
jgi:hypothetical protein